MRNKKFNLQRLKCYDKCGVYGGTRLDRIWNKYIRENSGITNIAGKMKKDILRLFKHAIRRNNDEIVK